MPKFAYLTTNLICPSCNTKISDIVCFQWGYCPSSNPKPGTIYQISDAIRWRACQDGQILPWTYFDTTRDSNIGSPNYQNLIVRDKSSILQPGATCTTCGHELAGAVVEIMHGHIVRARIYSRGEFDNSVDVYTIEDDGSINPQPDWNDHPMPLINDC